MATDETPKRRLKSGSTAPRDPESQSTIDPEREASFALIDRMRDAFADVSTEEIEREVAKAVAEVRAEMEAERLKSDRAE